MATQSHSTSSDASKAPDSAASESVDVARNVDAAWAVTINEASRNAKGPCLRVPIDLTFRVSDRKQAEIL